jgi:hypothetical protein
MKTRIRLAIAFVCLSVVSQSNAQSPHSITWTPRTETPGTQVTIAGTPFVLVRVPVRDLGGTSRYAVRFLARQIQGLSLIAQLITTHSAAPLRGSIEIDGFSAEAGVVDGRTYTINNSVIDPTQYNFRVDAQAICTVSVQVRRTLLVFSAFFTEVQQPETDIDTTPNAVPFAEWENYVDPRQQVRGCDRWIDYIRITPID